MKRISIDDIVRFLLISVLLMGWLLADMALAVPGAAEQAPKAYDKKPLVFVTDAVKSQFSDRIQYPARVRSQVNAWVVAESSGQVQTILKPVGSSVKKGQTVLIAKNTDPVFNYAPVKVVAPATGYVTSLEVDRFSRIERGEKLFSITDPSRLVIDVEIPAADLRLFKIGEIGDFSLSGGAEKGLIRGPAEQSALATRIVALSPAVDLRSGTASAKLEFTGKGQELGFVHQGQLGQVAFHVNARESFVLPESAIVSRAGANYVRVLNGSKAKLIPVSISLDLGDKVEISGGLTQGQKVITRWNRFIAEDEEVEIQSPEKSKQ